MADHVNVPIKMLGTDRWGQLSVFGDSHLICGESVKLRKQITASQEATAFVCIHLRRMCIGKFQKGLP